MVSCVHTRPAAPLLLILILLHLSAVSLFAERDSWQVESYVNWSEAALYVSVTAPLPTSGRNLPAAEHAVRREIEQEIARIFHTALQQLRVDSSTLVSMHAEQHPETAAALLSAVSEPRMIGVRRSSDMRSVQVDYRVELFPTIAQTIVTHKEPRPLPRVASWVPTRRYSGVLIFARGELPVHGEHVAADLQPALLPVVYDSNLRRVLSHEMLAGDTARSRGVVRYVSDIEDPLVAEVAGPDPLRITASGVFGRHRSDIMIPASAADLLLYGEHNSSLLRQARIVVIISAARIEERQTSD